MRKGFWVKSPLLLGNLGCSIVKFSGFLPEIHLHTHTCFFVLFCFVPLEHMRNHCHSHLVYLYVSMIQVNCLIGNIFCVLTGKEIKIIKLKIKLKN